MKLGGRASAAGAGAPACWRQELGRNGRRTSLVHSGRERCPLSVARGYLLVVFGEVSEKSSALSAAECTTGRGESGELSALGGTDEDFRYLLTGKPGPQSGERRGERSGLCRF